MDQLYVEFIPIKWMQRKYKNNSGEFSSFNNRLNLFYKGRIYFKHLK